MIYGVITFFMVIILLFLLIHMAPGDPARVLAGEYVASEEYLQLIRKEFGLDKPIYEQLIIYVLKVIRGDLGFSYRFGRTIV